MGLIFRSVIERQKEGMHVFVVLFSLCIHAMIQYKSTDCVTIMLSLPTARYFTWCLTFDLISYDTCSI